MTRSLVASTLIVSLVLAAAPASARIAGGGPTGTDCYSEWDEVDANATMGPNPLIDCEDGDPTCDADLTADGTCTFNVNVCILQTDVTGCTPVPLTALKPSRTLLGVKATTPFTPPSDLSAAGCGTAAVIKLPIKPARGSRPAKPSRKYKVKMQAISGERGPLKKDKDTLFFRCKPGTGTGTTTTTIQTNCAANPAGGPNEFKFVIQEQNTDLDNGWTGGSHSQPMVAGTPLRLCLQGCDAAGTTPCTQTTQSDSVNTTTFGAPLPLIASQVPVCVVNRFDNPKVTDGMVDFNTGEMSMTLHLLSDVYFTQINRLCPRCSGADVGQSGTCNGGPNNGRPCITEGVVTVPNAPAPNRYTLSSDCPYNNATASFSGTLTIPLPLTSGTSRLERPGQTPCVGQSQHNNCTGGDGACTRVCTGVAVTGGLRQYCCQNAEKSCHPTNTAAGEIGFIERVGFTTAPPAGTTFPKCGGDTSLAATFCESATTSNAINSVAGLPGPGAGIFPIKWQVKNSTDADCP